LTTTTERTTTDRPTEPASTRAKGPTPAVRLADVRVTFPRRGGGTLVALDNLSLEVEPGEIVAVLGPNGSGKSTLLRVVDGLLTPAAGQVEVEGRAVHGPDPAVGFVFQEPRLLPWRSAVDNVAYPLELAGEGRAARRARALELLKVVGVARAAEARPHELSGGMRQRVAFARTLLSGRTVLCLDEPFAALDALTRQEMQDWLAGALAIAPRTVVLVTHDVEEAIVLADRVVVLSPRPGRVVATLEVDVPRPRRRTDARLVALRERALQELRG
jgi:NitT/TauT family transport system ATP-binding protein